MDACDFFEAIDNLEIEKIKSLLATGKVSPNIEVSNRYLPVFECVLPDNFDEDPSEDDQRCVILKLLVEHGADVNVQLKVKDWDGAYYDVRYSYYMEGFTPAMFAARRGYLKCLRFLAHSGADLNVVIESELTPLLVAAEGKRAKCVAYLTQCVSSSILDHANSIGETALMFASRYLAETSMPYLLNAGANLNLQNGRKDTALMVAVQCKNIEAVKLLLDAGADVNIIRDDGETALTRALGNSDPSIVTTLLVSGADPTYSYSYFGLDRFHENVAVGRDAVVRTLVIHGFPPLDLQVTMFQDDDDDGDLAYLEELPISPLAVALLFGKPEIARYFIEIRFLTRFDILQLCWNRAIRRILQRLNKKECLEIVDSLSSRPHPLRTLSLVAITSVLTEDLVRLCLKQLCATTGDKDTWLFRPTFKEKVNSLGLPPSLTRALLHQA